MTDRSTAVRFDHVSRHFGSVRAVDDVSFEIRDGEFFSMLGPSGSGKTTCLRLIAGFELPTAGHLLLHGGDVSATPPYDRDVNTVFQDYALFPHMSVWENVAYGLMIRRVPKAERRRRAEEMLAMVKLGDLAGRRPAQLSGGQRQRVALARALVNRPSVLLLDEPLGALDLKLREAMQEELKALQRQVGITFVYVTHDQGEALAMSDRVAVFNRGRVEQIDTPSRDLRPAGHRLRRRLRRRLEHGRCRHRRKADGPGPALRPAAGAHPDPGRRPAGAGGCGRGRRHGGRRQLPRRHHPLPRGAGPRRRRRRGRDPISTRPPRRRARRCGWPGGATMPIR